MLKWLQRFIFGSSLEMRSGDRTREFWVKERLRREKTAIQYSRRNYEWNRSIEEIEAEPVDVQKIANEQALLRSLKLLHNHPRASMTMPDRLARIFLSISRNRRLAEAIEWDSSQRVLPESWDLLEEFRLAGDYYREHFRATALEIRRLILNPEELPELKQAKQGDCLSCRFFSGSQHLKCAVNPGRSMDEDCGEWEER